MNSKVEFVEEINCKETTTIRSIMQSSVKRRLSFTNNMGKSPRVKKKNHFNTPLKQTYTELASSPFTPGSTSDNLFQSVPNHYDEDYTLMSSPPMAITSSISRKNIKSIDNFITNTPVGLALNVGSDGKATIGQYNLKFLSNSASTVVSSASSVTTKHGSDPLETPTKGIHTSKQNSNETLHKSKDGILSLLKKMKNGCNSSNNNSVHSSASKPTHNILPSSPPMIAAPKTPRSIDFSQFIKTGMTPKVSVSGENTVMLDQILLDSDTTKTTNNKENIPVKPVLVPSDITSPAAQNSVQFPFKYSVGDPLLINDDVQWTEIINKSNTNSTHNNNKTNTQAKRFISFSSPFLKEPKTPRAQLDTLLAATHSAALQDPINDTVATNNLMVSNTNHQGHHHRQNSLQFTPLIQQTMTGSLSSKFSPRISLSPEKIINTNSIISTTSSISNNGEIDASTVLKSLITGTK